MLRAGALMVALLVLAPFTERSERGHLLLLCEVWPGHLKEYQQLIASDNDSYKTSVNRIIEQSTLKKDNRNYKNFRMNFKIHGKSAIRNHQLKYAVQFKINLNLVVVKKTIQISKQQLVTFSNVLMERNCLRRFSILMNTNLKDCKVKMNWHINVRKKFEGNKSHASYFENGCKYMETRSPMSYMAHQANILRSEELLQKSQKSLGSIMLKFTKQHKGEDHIERNILKEKCKNSIDRLLASMKEKFCRNEYNKNLHRIVSDEQKILNTERKKYIRFKSLQQKKNIKEKIKMWKWKRRKKSIYANQKLQFRHLFTFLRNSHIQKVYLTQKKMFNIQRKKIPVFQTKIYRNKHLIQKWGNIVRARKESKFEEDEMGMLFKNCYMHFSIINLKFLTITICMKQELFSSRKYQTQQLMQVKKMLRYLLPSSERVKKYFSLSQKGLEMSFLKTPMVKQLIKKEGFIGLTSQYFYKDIFNGPSSTVERTKRSAKNKSESISVGALQHLSNALIAGATIFGIALFIIVLAGFYLYLKRRQVLKFFNTVIKDGKSSHKSKSTDAQDYAPISVSQNFHFVQSKDPRKRHTEMTADVEAHAKDHVSVKEMYDSSDTEGNSKKSHRGLSIRSRAYMFPSRSSGSVHSFYDDVCDICSAQFSLSDEFIEEKPYSNLPSTTTKAKEAVSVACQTNHCLKDDQNYDIHTDISPQLKIPTISRSKSENDILKPSSSNTSHPVQPLTHDSKVQNP